MSISRVVKTYDKAPHVKEKVIATTDPVSTTDGSQQFEVGSEWFNTTTNTLWVCVDHTNGAAVWVARALGFQRFLIDETVVITTAASHNLVATLPVGAIPVVAQMNFNTAITLVTAVNVGFGTAGSLVGYCESADSVVAKNTKTLGKGALCGTPVAATTTLRLSACATDGSAAGTLAGTVRCRLYYDLMTAIPSAA